MAIGFVYSGTWTVVQAKAKLSELIGKSQRGTASYHQEWQKCGRGSRCSQGEKAQRIGREGKLADFLLNSPLRGSVNEVTRLKGGQREIRL